MSNATISLNDTVNRFLFNNNITIGYMNEAGEEYLEEFEEKLDIWLSYIDEKDHEIFLFLLENYTYVTRKNLKLRLKELYEKYKEMEADYEDTIFVPVSSFGGITNGAITIIDCFKEANKKINKKNIAVQFKEFYDEFNLDGVKNLVLLDDVIGSGTTFIDFLVRSLKNTPEPLLNKKIYLMSVFNLEKGLNLIENDLKEWDITLINKEIYKGIYSNENIYSDDNLKSKIIEHKRKINKYEKKIWGDPKNIYVGGYKKSNALLSFYYNTPNNTFSTFWKNKENEWYPIFPRTDDENKFEVKNKKIFKDMVLSRNQVKNRKEYIKDQIEKEMRNSNIFYNDDDLDFKMILILIYFNNKRVYSAYDLINLLSVNLKTLDFYINELIYFGLIEENEENSQLEINENGETFLYRKFMNNIKLDALDERVKEDSGNGQGNFKKENIFFVPKISNNKL